MPNKSMQKIMKGVDQAAAKMDKIKDYSGHRLVRSNEEEIINEHGKLEKAIITKSDPDYEGIMDDIRKQPLNLEKQRDVEGEKRQMRHKALKQMEKRGSDSLRHAFSGDEEYDAQQDYATKKKIMGRTNPKKLNEGRDTVRKDQRDKETRGMIMRRTDPRRLNDEEMHDKLQKNDRAAISKVEKQNNPGWGKTPKRSSDADILNAADAAEREHLDNIIHGGLSESSYKILQSAAKKIRERNKLPNKDPNKTLRDTKEARDKAYYGSFEGNK